MTSLLKLVALSVFATGAATIAAATPSQAQVPCCTPATKVVATGSAGWTVKPPNSGPIAAVNITQVNPFWAPAIPGSKWIGPISSGVQPQAGGIYIYSFRFCLCPLPNGVSTIPANLSFHVYADDAFTAKLNGNVIGQKLTGWSFTSASPPAPAGQAAAPGGTVVNATASFKCDNVLTFEVQNGGTNPTPTGLDVYGTISGYFGQPAFPSAGQPCPCAASHEPTA